MANIWRKDDNVKEQPKRNIMDLSFQNNLSTQFGKLVPVFCKEFIPGDSFSIKPTFSLKFQPMVFPIQTRMRAHLHFFKVRNRNLWKDWEDFIAKNKENLDPPYLDTAVTKPITGSLLDYLGVPTTCVGSYGSYVEKPIANLVPLVLPAFADYDGGTCYYRLQQDFTGPSNGRYGIMMATTLTSDSPSYFHNYKVPVDTMDLGEDTTSHPSTFAYVLTDLGIVDYVKSGASKVCVQLGQLNGSIVGSIDDYMNEEFPVLSSSNDGYLRRPANTPRYKYYKLGLRYVDTANNRDGVIFYTPYACDTNGLLQFDLSSLPDANISYNVSNFTGECYLHIVSACQALNNAKDGYLYLTNSTLSETFTASHEYDAYLSNGYLRFGALSVRVYGVSSDEVVDIDDSTSPYWRSGVTTDLRERIKLSALPCRAYEQIYNSFYRNAENNPYILNGVPEYNKYMPTDEGGVDTNLYDFHFRNWEDDFLTTALQQPQAGIAPLVGLTGTAGTATVTLADENGNTSEATASYDEDGNVISVAFANNTSLTEALADAVNYGISINDLRNVNAFQRWLEAKARGGYKYRDVIETMFGISVRYDTLDMPEFIGGTSIDIMVNQISQTVPTETSPLGDYAGQASGIGTGQTINEYFDEHGFVIGILSVVPVPNYSQLLPKHFIKRDAFDYYFPQFGHIGMQPIKYDEVCPIQAYQESSEQNNVLDETFGYQRAWYEYLASTDEVHGEFRTNLRNFVMNRTFNVKPELVNEFLTVDPSQLNDVFAIQDGSYDKIIGQIYFDVKAKRPIPLYGIPKLE